MSILLRIVLSVVLIGVGIVAFGMGLASPMIADNPANITEAQIAFDVCMSVFVLCVIGFVSVWWRPTINAVKWMFKS